MASRVTGVNSSDAPGAGKRRPHDKPPPLKDRPVLRWVLLALATALIGAVVSLPFTWSGISDWRWTGGTSRQGDAVSGHPTMSSSSAPSGDPTNPTELVVGQVRFSFPEIHNAVHPNVLRLPSAPPEVSLVSVSASGANRMLQVKLSGLGISIIQISMLGPDGSQYMLSAEILTSQPEMEFTYGVFPEEGGPYTAVVTDLRTGLSTRASINLPAQRKDPTLTGPPIGNSPQLEVSGVTGRACDPAGAIVSIRARQLSGDDTMRAMTPTNLSGTMFEHIDYIPATDAMGDGYYAVAVQSTRCTGQPIIGFTAKIGDRALIDFQVPN